MPTIVAAATALKRKQVTYENPDVRGWAIDSVSAMCPLADNSSEVHHGKRAAVNVLLALHCNEISSRFQPVCAHDQHRMLGVTEGGSILTKGDCEET